MKLILLDVQLYTILGISTAVTLAILAALFYYVPIGLWVTAQFSGVRISIGQLIGMRLRRVQPKAIVDEMIKLKKARIEGISLGQLEAHFLANGDVNKVVDALISASNAHINLNFESASAIDLAGRDILQAVKDSVNTKVIDAPPVEAVAKDGIQLIVKSRITVRAQIERLVGGAGEETVVARVGQGIVGAIGSADTHETIMADPSLISERLLSEGFSAGLAYDILSIDIADIDVGQSVGARLKADEAKAELQVARAKAEEKRAEAAAEEQYFRARVQEMRAKVIEAEAQVPMAIAEAFRLGNLGIMDYYRLQNMEADTRMRQSFSDLDDKPADDEDTTGSIDRDSPNS